MQFIRSFRLRLSEIRLYRDTQSENGPFPHSFHTFGARFHSHRPHEYRNNKLSINILNTMAHDWIFLIAKPNSNTNEDIQTYSGFRSRSADRSVMRRKIRKYQTLLAQRDSLLTVEQKYDQTLEILNEIETGFQSIREVEDRVMTQIATSKTSRWTKNNRWYRRSTKSRVSCSKTRSESPNSKHNSHKAAARTLRWPGRSNVCRKK